MTLSADPVVLRVFARDAQSGQGNPATVVRLDRDAEPSALLAMARAAATPVCAFLLPGSPPRARFFTVSSELAFCVHGALAAGFDEAVRRGSDVVTLAAGDRLLRIARTEDDMVYLALPAGGLSAVEPDPAPVLAALGLAARDVANDRIDVASTGSPKWLVRLHDRAALSALRPDMPMLAQASEKAGVNGAYVYVRGDEAAPADILARGFNPYGGVDEDAATGSAAAALAWSLRDELAQRWLTIDQGIGLTALNRIRVRIADGEIHVGGRIGQDPDQKIGEFR